MLTKQELIDAIEACKKVNGHINWRKLFTDDMYIPVVNALRDYYKPDMSDIERAYRLFNNQGDEKIICSVCNVGHCKFHNFHTGFRPVCSVKCSNNSPTVKQNKKNANIKKYGVENVFQLNEVKEKSKQSIQERYGVDNISKSEYFKSRMNEVHAALTGEQRAHIKEKASITCSEKYGVSHQSKANAIKDKKKNTFLSNYGETHYFKTAEHKENIEAKNTLLYGVDNPFKSSEWQEQNKKNNIEKYGVANPSGLDWVIEKRKDTHNKKCGRDWHTQTHISDEAFALVKDKEKLALAFEELGAFGITRKYGVSLPWLAKHLKDADLWNPSKSWCEHDVRTWLTNNNFSYVQNDRTTIAPLEIDFLVENKVAIEVNGVYFHSELAGKDKNYHRNKMTRVLENGHRMFMIYDYELLSNSDLVYSMLMSRLNITTKLFARKTELYVPTHDETAKFLNENHIQGNVSSPLRLALRYEGEIVSLMTMSKTRFSKKEATHEMVRFCSKRGLTVVGALSKLFINLVKVHNIESCVTYADLRFGVGDAYKSVGFTQVGITPPNYWYFDSKKAANLQNFKLESRIKYQKHKLKNILTIFDESKTEWENMVINGYNRVWDCGNMKYLWRRKI